MYVKFYQNIAKDSRDRASFTYVSLYHNLNLGKASTNDKWHLTILWTRYCQYQYVCKLSSQYSTQFKRYCHFRFFRIWSSAKPRPMTNIILQPFGLDLVNINVSANFYQKIPNDSRIIWAFVANCPGTKSSQTDQRQNLRKLTGDKQLHKLSQGDYRAHSESQPSASLSVDFLRVV